MAEVYRARDGRLQREVALKVVNEALAADPELVKRFEQEARVAGSLNHPNLVAVYDVGVQDDAPYFVTELLQGESLRQRMSRGPHPARHRAPLGGTDGTGPGRRPRPGRHPPRREARERLRHHATVRSSCSTSASPSCRSAGASRAVPTASSTSPSPPPARRHGPARCSDRPATCPRSRSAGRRSTPAPTSSASVRSSTRCSPASAPSPAAPSSRAATPSCTPTRRRSIRRSAPRWPRWSAAAWRRSPSAVSRPRGTWPSRWRSSPEPADRRRSPESLLQDCDPDTGSGCRWPSSWRLGLVAGAAWKLRPPAAAPLAQVEQITFREEPSSRHASRPRVGSCSALVGRRAARALHTHAGKRGGHSPRRVASLRARHLARGRAGAVPRPRTFVRDECQGMLARVTGPGNTPREVMEGVTYADWSPSGQLAVVDGQRRRSSGSSTRWERRCTRPGGGSPTPGCHRPATRWPSFTIRSSPTTAARWCW